MKDLSVDLQSPDGTTVSLFGNGNVVGNNFGVDSAGDAPVTFIDSAGRVISENKGSGTHQGLFRPAGGSLDSKFGGMDLATAISGPWHLIITNLNTSSDANVRATLHLTSVSNPVETPIPSSPRLAQVNGALTTPYPLRPAVMPNVGIGPAPSSPQTTRSADTAPTPAGSISPSSLRQNINITDSTKVDDDVLRRWRTILAIIAR